MNNYILTDRTTATKYKVEIVDNEIVLTSTSDTASVDPVIVDEGDYSRWKFFVDDGQWGYEPTSDAYSEIITLLDSISGILYRLVIINGEFGWVSTTRITRFRTTRINRVFTTTRHRILS